MKIKRSLATLIICTVWTLFVFKIFSDYREIINNKERDTFEKAVVILQDKIESYNHALQGMGGLVASYNYRPTIAQIRKYAEFRDFFNNFPGALGYGWISITPDEKLEDHIRTKRQESKYYNYKQLTPHQNTHFIIDVIEPLEINQDALGLDVSSERNRREAAEKAISSAKPTLTAPITLIQDKKKGVGFLFFHPLYSTNTPPKTVKERQNKAMGFAYAPISAAAIIKGLHEKIPTNFLYQVSDITNSTDTLLIYSNSKINQNDRSYSKKIEIGGRLWLFEAYSKDNQLIKLGQIIAFIAVILGGLFLYYLTRIIVKAFEDKGHYKQKAETIEHLHQLILNSTNYSMISTDKNGIITSINKAGLQMLGYSASELVNKQTVGIFHDPQEIMKRTEELKTELGIDLVPGFDTFTIKANLTKMPDKNEWTYIRKDGSRLTIMLSVTAIYDKEGNVQSYLGVAEDISDYKKMEQIIEEQRIAMLSSAKLSALGEMAAGIAHEINNPLTILDSRIQMIEEMIENQMLTGQSMLDNFNKVHAMIDRIIKIVKGLRTFSRDGSKDNLRPTSIGKIIEETLDLCKERFAKNNITIEVTGNIDTIINCREVEISQVLMNLLNNSFDAIKSRNEKWIKIDAKMLNKNRIAITFSDSGPGIPQSIADKIMEPFFTTKDVGQGTGLGLSISKGIIESHSGVFKYNSKHPNTQFIIELPV